MWRKIFFSFVLAIGFLFGQGQQTSEKFIQETDYLLYLPDGYAKDTAAKWPLVLFLHGSGESGHDLEKVKVHGPPKLVAEGRKFPFILVSPQAPDPGTGWEPNTLYRLLQDVKGKYHVDPDRVYLTGLSMGGFGSWALAIKHPEEFAAVVPICGGGDTAEIWRLRNTPIWCFHGALDRTVPLARSQQMVGALKRYNASARLTVYPDADHNSWTRTYDNDSLYQWLLAQKRFTYKRVAADPALLKQYAGWYANSDRDTVQLFVEKDTLKARTRQGTIELKPASSDIFYIHEDRFEDLRFIRGNSGRTTGFLFYGDGMILFKKYE